MATRPITINGFEDVAANTISNIMANKQDRILEVPSLVAVYGVREAVSVTWDIGIGNTVVGKELEPNLETTNGEGPHLPEDLLVVSAGAPGEEIRIDVNNATAGALENHAKVLVIPLDSAQFLTLPF